MRHISMKQVTSIALHKRNRAAVVLSFATMSPVTALMVPSTPLLPAESLGKVMASDARKMLTLNALPTRREFVEHTGASLLSFIDTNEKQEEQQVAVPLHKLDSTTTTAGSLVSALELEREYPADRDRAKVVGHRGALYMELENTLKGFETSAEIGCDAVELDVFLLKCGTLVVFHGGGTDENPGCLRDYCGLQSSILDYTYDETKNFRFNADYEEFGCPKEKIVDATRSYIPTLEEVLLKAKSSGLKLMIELKGAGTAEPVLEMVEKLDMVDQCQYSSFSHDRIALIRKLRPDRLADGTYRYKTGALFTEPPENFVEMAQSVGASEVHLQYDMCTKKRVNAIHDAGMDSMAWFRGPIGMRKDCMTKYCDVGNEDDSMYQVVLNTGVRSMCVNRPDVLIGLQKELSWRKQAAFGIRMNSEEFTYEKKPELVAIA